MQHFLNFFDDPHGHLAFREIFLDVRGTSFRSALSRSMFCTGSGNVKDMTSDIDSRTSDTCTLICCKMTLSFFLNVNAVDTSTLFLRTYALKKDVPPMLSAGRLRLRILVPAHRRRDIYAKKVYQRGGEDVHSVQAPVCKGGVLPFSVHVAILHSLPGYRGPLQSGQRLWCRRGIHITSHHSIHAGQRIRCRPEYPAREI